MYNALRLHRWPHKHESQPVRPPTIKRDVLDYIDTHIQTEEIVSVQSCLRLINTRLNTGHWDIYSPSTVCHPWVHSHCYSLYYIITFHYEKYCIVLTILYYYMITDTSLPLHRDLHVCFKLPYYLTVKYEQFYSCSLWSCTVMLHLYVMYVMPQLTAQCISIQIMTIKLNWI